MRNDKTDAGLFWGQNSTLMIKATFSSRNNILITFWRKSTQVTSKIRQESKNEKKDSRREKENNEKIKE